MANQNRTLEDRIRAIEDRLEIYTLIASHPPSADTGADYYTRTAYVEDGELDLGRGKATTGNETIAAVTKTPAHQAAIAGGLAHFAGLPRILTINEDPRTHEPRPERNRKPLPTASVVTFRSPSWALCETRNDAQSASVSPPCRGVTLR